MCLKKMLKRKYFTLSLNWLLLFCSFYMNFMVMQISLGFLYSFVDVSEKEAFDFKNKTVLYFNLIFWTVFPFAWHLTKEHSHYRLFLLIKFQ